MHSALSKIAAATPTGGGNNIRDGRYLYYVEKIQFTPAGIGAHNGARYVIEYRVIEAEAVTLFDKGKEITPVPNQVGTTCSLVCLLDKYANAAGNAKAAVLALASPLNYTEEDITADMLLDVASAENPLRGVAVRNETRSGVNKGTVNKANEGMRLTLNSWSVVEQTEEDIKAQRAFLDRNGARTPAAAPSTALADAISHVEQKAAAVEPPPPPTGTKNILARLGKK